MFRLLVCFTLLFSSSVLQAEESIILIISGKGYSLLTQDANGNAALIPITQVIVVGKPNISVPPTSPSNAKIKELLTLIPKSATAIEIERFADALTQAIQSMQSASFSKDGSLAQGKALVGGLLRLAAATITNPDWAPFAQKFNTLIAELTASGELSSINDFVAILSEIVKGFK